MQQRSVFSSSILTVVAVSSVQADVAVPTIFDASTNGPVAQPSLIGMSERHYQLMIDGAVLGIAPGDQITAIGWRIRAGSVPASSWPAVDATWSQFDVTIGQAVTTVPTMSLNFAENIASPLLVRTGSLTIPAGSLSRSAIRPDINSFTPLISLSTPYVYQGGNIVIDITHDASSSSFTNPNIDSICTDVELCGPMGYGTTIRAIQNGSIAATTAFNYNFFPITQLQTVSSVLPPPNDVCASARPLFSGEYFSTELATQDGAASCSSSGHDVWYTFTGPSSWSSFAPGTVTVTVEAESFTPVLSAHDESCAGAALGCVIGDGDGQTRLTLPVNAGQTIVLRVGGENSS